MQPVKRKIEGGARLVQISQAHMQPCFSSREKVVPPIHPCLSLAALGAAGELRPNAEV